MHMIPLKIMCLSPFTIDFMFGISCGINKH
jgi:hypothetical protein